jgi:hypothetical protein
MSTSFSIRGNERFCFSFWFKGEVNVVLKNQRTKAEVKSDLNSDKLSWKKIETDIGEGTYTLEIQSKTGEFSIYSLSFCGPGKIFFHALPMQLYNIYRL